MCQWHGAGGSTGGIRSAAAKSRDPHWVEAFASVDLANRHCLSSLAVIMCPDNFKESIWQFDVPGS